MAKRIHSLVLPAIVALSCFAAPVSAGLLPSDLVLGAGNTFAVTGSPTGGGVSLRAVPQWRVTERLRAGWRLPKRNQK